MIELQKAAEILVECGYAERLGEHDKQKIYVSKGKSHLVGMRVDPFADTLEGRRQADAIEDWLTLNRYRMYQESEKEAESAKKPYSKYGSFWYQHRLNRIKWCLQQTGEIK